jgi:hypothetical protein
MPLKNRRDNGAEAEEGIPNADHGAGSPAWQRVKVLPFGMK